METCTDDYVHLTCFHLQTGSCVKVGLKYTPPRTEQSDTYCHQQMQFLQGIDLVNDKNKSSLVKMFSFLAWRRMEQISQPVVLITSYAIVWQVPNIAQNKLTIYMIKALPFTPIECIF